MTKKKIFITQRIVSKSIELLEEADLDVETWHLESSIPPQMLLEKASSCHGLITMLGDKIDSEFIEKCSTLQVISNYAVGFNNIDITAATKAGISVGNTPGVLTDATADLTMALILNLSRKIIPANQNVTSGDWNRWESMSFLGNSLKGKTLGIFGLGRIGQALAKRCVDGFGMKLIYCANSKKDMGTRVDLETLLKESDVLSLHSPLTEQTRGILDYKNLNKLKKNCILINTARGELIDQAALISLLNKDHLFGVGLDVTTPEPLPVNSELLKFSRVLITPHIGSADIETRTAMSEMVAMNIIAGLKHEVLPGFVNPEIRREFSKHQT